MELSLEEKANLIIQRIRRYLITIMGVTEEQASSEEFYRAFAMALREVIMMHWTARIHSYRSNQSRQIFYICMEYLPGRFLKNNIINLKALDFVKRVMEKMNRDFSVAVPFECDPGLGNGGLGRLASCFLDSLATQCYPAVGYGLRYQYGIFDQEVWGGVQVERPDIWLMAENPWEIRRDKYAEIIQYGGRLVKKTNKKGEEVYDIDDCDEVRALSYDIPIVGYRASEDFNVVTMRLWTTKESPRNFQLQRFNAGQLDQAAENTTLTDVLYPNDNNEMGKRIRLKQEFLLVSASLQDIFAQHEMRFQDISKFADKVRIQINDTHPALIIPELIHILTHDHDFSWGEAWETVKTCCGYTNHTVLKESLEEWNQNRLQQLLPRQYRIIERLNQELCNSVRKQFPGDEERVRRMSILEGGQIKMAHLAIYGSHRVNGVAALHTQILKETIFKDFNQMYSDRFINITNGVTQRRWLLDCNPLLASFITERIGSEWICDFTKIKELSKSASDPASQEEFLRLKRENKKRLVRYLNERNPIRDSSGKVIAHTPSLPEDALFDLQIKRLHEYKRQLMNVLHLLMVYYELKANREARKIKRQVIIGGKAAPGYALAKNIIQLIYAVGRKVNADPDVNSSLRLIFLENYNVSKAEIAIPAADLSQQISTSGQEASGTGNMKLTINGALTIGTEDGANVEMHQEITDAWWPFSFGLSASEIAEIQKNRSYNPWDYYNKDPQIRQVVDALRNRSLAQTDGEHQAFLNLHRSLLEGLYSEMADRYFVLKDLRSYYDAQKKVEELYLTPNKWAEYAIHNIAGMGVFSSDQSIHNYAKLVWDLSPLPIDEDELQLVRFEYKEHL
ncbi:MAG: glycogen phosphorylase [Chlamydiae bacterium GWA2_50_15]|nr:MAG: glycogen phosphorylase [Chlamydiae bacterium GWA2_50_15]OGN58398.1 MAG: glycogen phosphorylase [Chlamydiae bacterium RIFCSPHIGHO2_02_FULL_49_29]OGN64568.1 MAG: glycogen phosphorylase [Chlamydiae bacterium RIFCSPHIGHO2_12_FULL_49_32]OGN71092.1 MAG: glycogen phosphorylase [Chlamydiae bacterium RIFCSPLOWO2_02_FULL_49_12]